MDFRFFFLLHPTCTTQELFAKAMMSLSSQKKAESDLLIISNLLNSFIAYTLLVALCLTCRGEETPSQLKHFNLPYRAKYDKYTIFKISYNHLTNTKLHGHY